MRQLAIILQVIVLHARIKSFSILYFCKRNRYFLLSLINIRPYAKKQLDNIKNALILARLFFYEVDRGEVFLLFRWL